MVSVAGEPNISGAGAPIPQHLRHRADRMGGPDDAYLQRCRFCGAVLLDHRPRVAGEPVLGATEPLWAYTENAIVEIGPGYQVLAIPVTEAARRASDARECHRQPDVLAVLVYRSYAANRRHSPHVAPVRWGQLEAFHDWQELEACYQAELATLARARESMSAQPCGCDAGAGHVCERHGGVV